MQNEEPGVGVGNFRKGRSRIFYLRLHNPDCQCHSQEFNSGGASRHTQLAIVSCTAFYNVVHLHLTFHSISSNQ